MRTERSSYGLVSLKATSSGVPIHSAQGQIGQGGLEVAHAHVVTVGINPEHLLTIFGSLG